MTETITLVIERGDNSMATSFLVWAKYRTYPQNDGDGVFVGEVEITAAETSVTTTWNTPNNNADWKIIAIPKFMDQVGIPGRIEAV